MKSVWVAEIQGPDMLYDVRQARIRTASGQGSWRTVVTAR
jgi:hypothetical protein